MKLYALLLLILLASCFSRPRIVRPNLEGTWELSSFPSNENGFAEVFQQRKPGLVLSTDGKLSGSTGCNRLTGTYIAYDDRFKVSEGLGMTKMACPGYDETVFLEALKRANRFVHRGNELILLENDRVIMGFTRADGL